MPQGNTLTDIGQGLATFLQGMQQARAQAAGAQTADQLVAANNQSLALNDRLLAENRQLRDMLAEIQQQWTAHQRNDSLFAAWAIIQAKTASLAESVVIAHAQCLPQC